MERVISLLGSELICSTLAKMVKALIPKTRIQANPKHRFASYLHVAVEFGQSEIFEEIFRELKRKKCDWQNLRDRQYRTAFDLLKDNLFRLRIPRDPGNPIPASVEKTEEYKQFMLKFIENLS